MPRCHCITHQCRGAERSRKTFDHHGALDTARALLIEEKEEETQRALDEEDELVESQLSLQGHHRAQDDLGTLLYPEDGELRANLSKSFLQLNLGDNPRLSYTLPGGLPELSITTATGLNEDETALPVTPHEQEATLSNLENEFSALNQAIRKSSVAKPSFREDTFTALDESTALKRIARTLSIRWPAETRSIKSKKETLLGRVDLSRKDLKQLHSKWTQDASLLPSQSGHDVYDTGHHFLPLLLDYHPVVQLVMLLVATLQVITHASRREGEFLLAMISLIIKMALECHPASEFSTLGMEEKSILDKIPKQPRTVLDHFDLEPKYKIYAVCPSDSCHRLHAPVFEVNSKIPHYPQVCSGGSPSSPTCNTELTTPRTINGRIYHRPKKRYVVFSIKDWISGLMARPGYEDRMDSIWNRGTKTDIDDIFDGEFLRNFKGPDGKLFSEGVSAKEARYALSMSLDFFNPGGNKVAGKSVSTGVVSLVNLNLPPEERYKPDNMCVVAIIPGPKEPSVDHLNSYLEPIVDQLLEFWKPGVKLSKTAKSLSGRLVLLALVILICDLPAARKTAGFTGHSHEYFCSVCHNTRKSHGLNNTDIQTWRLKTDQECRATASDLLSIIDDRTKYNALVDTTGIRWSELTRLEYFDMVKCVAVDAMHNLFLDSGIANADGVRQVSKKMKKKKFVLDLNHQPPPIFPATDRKSLKKLQKYLNKPLVAAIQSKRELVLDKLATQFNLQSLLHLVRELQCDIPIQWPDGTSKPIAHLSRKEAASVLVLWRVSCTEGLLGGGDTETAVYNAFNKEELKELRRSINSVLKPSWISSLPSSLGEAAHGKLKADQWRVLASVHLPLALIRLWGISPPVTERSKRCKMLLDTTMKLVSAIMLATSRTMTSQTPTLYIQFMKEYLDDIKELFPTYKFAPNHHMALHLDLFLRLFGPVHAWWTFPFERAIGMLQRIPTNPVVGDAQITMALSFHKAAKLRAMFSAFNLPPSFENARTAFLRLIIPPYRHVVFSGSDTTTPLFGRPTDLQTGGTESQGDPLSPEESDLDNEAMQDEQVQGDLKWKPCNDTLVYLVRPHLASQHPIEVSNLQSYFLGGVRYSPQSRHKGNSQIIFWTAEGTRSYGQIQNIMHIRAANSRDSPTNKYDTVVLIRPYHPFQLQNDPYQAYPILRACLLRPIPGALQLIQPSQIISHFASLFMVLPSQDEVLACISLSRDV